MKYLKKFLRWSLGLIHKTIELLKTIPKLSKESMMFVDVAPSEFNNEAELTSSSAHPLTKESNSANGSQPKLHESTD